MLDIRENFKPVRTVHYWIRQSHISCGFFLTGIALSSKVVCSILVLALLKEIISKVLSNCDKEYVIKNKKSSL